MVKSMTENSQPLDIIKNCLHYDSYSDRINLFVRSNRPKLLPKEVLLMAKCSVCDKGAHFGIAVSHSHRRSNKMWKSNIKSVKVKVNGAARKMYVCTSCLRSGKVERA